MAMVEEGMAVAVVMVEEGMAEGVATAEDLMVAEEEVTVIVEATVEVKVGEAMAEFMAEEATVVEDMVKIIFFPLYILYVN